MQLRLRNKIIAKSKRVLRKINSAKASTAKLAAVKISADPSVDLSPPLEHLQLFGVWTTVVAPPQLSLSETATQSCFLHTAVCVGTLDFRRIVHF